MCLYITRASSAFGENPRIAVTTIKTENPYVGTRLELQQFDRVNQVSALGPCNNVWCLVQIFPVLGASFGQSCGKMALFSGCNIHTASCTLQGKTLSKLWHVVDHCIVPVYIEELDFRTSCIPCRVWSWMINIKLVGIRSVLVGG